MRELTAIKLGGSLLTDKQRESTARHGVMVRLAAELAAAPWPAGGILLAHGSGSFGHMSAARHGLHRGAPVRDALGAAATQRQAHQLHRLLMEELLAAEIAVFSLFPSSLMIGRRGVAELRNREAVVAALDAGLVPVVLGDVLLDAAGAGASIVSTEDVIVALGREPLGDRRLSRVVWVGETEGIYDEAGATIAELDAGGAERLLEQVEGASGRDVTGGIRLRLEMACRLAERGVESLMIDGRRPGALGAALAGDASGGTRVRGAP